MNKITFIRRDVFGYLFYILSAILLLYISSFFNDVPAYERPFDICRVITNHVYEDIIYGGLSNYIAMYLWQLFLGILTFAFAFPFMYFLDKYVFKSFFMTTTNIVDAKDPSKLYYFLFFFIVIPLPAFLFNIYPLFNDNCENIIRTVESFW